MGRIHKVKFIDLVSGYSAIANCFDDGEIQFIGIESPYNDNSSIGIDI